MGIISLSRPATLWGLGISEVALLLCGLVLVVGLVGEYAESAKWKRHVKIFEMMVILGVAGELIGDGGVFLFSAHLQTMADAELAAVTRQAGSAQTSADKAAAGAARANFFASQAEQRAGRANAKADRFRLQIAKASDHAAEANRIAETERLARVKIEKRLAPRSLSPEERIRIVSRLKAFPRTQYDLALDPVPEAINFLTVVEGVLRSSGWVKAPFVPTDKNVFFSVSFKLNGGEQVNMAYLSGVTVAIDPRSISRLGPPASALALALRNGGIGTREVISQQVENVDAIHVIIGTKP